VRVDELNACYGSADRELLVDVELRLDGVMRAWSAKAATNTATSTPIRKRMMNPPGG
jgi:hypothetical protein